MKNKSIFGVMYTILAFAIPVSSAGMMNMIASFIAMMMVAQLGREPLAAGALATTTYITLMTVTGTILQAVGILISHHRGQGKAHAEVSIIVKNGIWLAIILFFPVAFVLWHADKLLMLFDQEPTLVKLTRPYFHYASISMLPLLINAVFFQYFAGIGRPKFTMLLALIGLPFTVFVSYCFILGNFGMPRLGLAGMAFTGIIVQCMLLLGSLFMIYFMDREYQLFVKPFSLNVPMCKTIFNLGLPIGIQFGGEIAAMSVATYMMGYFGVTALAASQVISQYSLLVLMVSLGLTQALSILTSRAYGQRDLVSIQEYLHGSLAILVLFFIVVTILFAFFPAQLITFYVAQHALNEQLLSLGSTFFVISIFGLFFDAIRHLLSGALRGLHDSHAPMRIGIITLWLISLPASYLVAFPLHFGPIGLRIAFISGFIIAAILLWKRMQHTLNKIKEHEQK